MFSFWDVCMKIYPEKYIGGRTAAAEFKHSGQSCLSGPDAFPLMVFRLTQSAFLISPFNFIRYSLSFFLRLVFRFRLDLIKHMARGYK